MHLRSLVWITLLALGRLQGNGQAAGNAPPASAPQDVPAANLPDDPGQEALPLATPEPIPPEGVPLRWQALHQSRIDDTWTLEGNVVVYYRDYILRADRIVYHHDTSELDADGHLQVTGGPDDVLIKASRGEMRLDMHTARFYNVTGSVGLRRAGNVAVYSITNPFLFSGRVLLQTSEGHYRIVDGTMTNCRLPHPDWQLLARAIRLDDREASTANTFFRLFGVPIFYLPYLRHPVDATGRESGILIPVISNSSIKGLVLGEQVYIVLNRSMDMVVGTEYYSHRGWAPNGDFRYKGVGLDHLSVRWNALLDRGIDATPPATGRLNQGGADVVAEGRRDITPRTRLAGNIEYLSSYVYRLVFDENYSQAVNSEVQSLLSLTHEQNGFIPSGFFARLQTFASSAPGDEARIIHMPTLRFDVLDRPLGDAPVYWGLASSLGELSRAEPDFHAHNVGRVDLYPHLSVPIVAGGWSIVPEVALRETLYSSSQTPNPAGGTPAVSHDALNRGDVEAALDVRLPAVERDFTLARWNRTLRHVIEPEFTYRFVGGIGTNAQNVLLVDTTDIATDTNEAGFSLTQRFYVKPRGERPCAADDGDSPPGACQARAREWASWQIAQKFYIDPTFGGALNPSQRNVFASTLDLSGIAFLTAPRNVSPVISRVRFEAIPNLRAEWDMDYDPRLGRLGADNLFAGYSLGRTTLGLGHALLNAVDEQGNAATTIQSQQIAPYLQIGKQNGAGFNLAASAGYDFVHGAVQYAGAQANYNWDCCGLTLGYRRFELGTVGNVGRDETEWLYSFTLANFGSVGDIRHSNTIFRDPAAPPLY